MRGRTVTFVASLLTVVGWAAAANATPNFPPYIETYFGLGSLVYADNNPAGAMSSSGPQCMICHNDPSGGVGTVTTNFGAYMRSRGLVSFDVSSLANALEADSAEMHVSNSQGIADVEALMMGHDPNDPGSSGSATRASPPQYGCGAQVSSSDRGAAGATPLFAVAALALGVGRRRRRRGVRAEAKPLPSS